MNNTNLRERILNVASTLGKTIPQIARESGVSKDILYGMTIGKTVKVSSRAYHGLTSTYPMLNGNYLLTGVGPVLKETFVAPVGSDMILVPRSLWIELMNYVAEVGKPAGEDLTNSRLGCINSDADQDVRFANFLCVE